MQENWWAVRFEKSQNGKVCMILKGRFYFSFWQLVSGASALVALLVSIFM